MIISIASGKGGTGKTFISTNLAWSLQKEKPMLLDCDVDEPNTGIFMKPEIETEFDVNLPVPDVDLEKCIHCSKCRQVCEFNAITDIGTTVLVFPQLCHGCGACTMACPVDAITETKHYIGKVKIGKTGNVDFVSGELELREVASPFIIREVKQQMNPERLNIIDSSPGTTCQAVSAISDTDYCVLVTEPTPFGFHDLKLAIEMVEKMKIPYGVVINRVGIGNDDVANFCNEKKINILLKIPHSLEIAKITAKGELAAEKLPWLDKDLKKLYSCIREAVKADD